MSVTFAAFIASYYRRYFQLRNSYLCYTILPTDSGGLNFPDDLCCSVRGPNAVIVFVVFAEAYPCSGSCQTLLRLDDNQKWLQDNFT